MIKDDETKGTRYNLSEAAEYIGCSAQTLRRYIKKGGAPTFLKVFQRYYFYKEDMDNWLLMQRINSAPFKRIEAYIKKLNRE